MSSLIPLLITLNLVITLSSESKKVESFQTYLQSNVPIHGLVVGASGIRSGQVRTTIEIAGYSLLIKLPAGRESLLGKEIFLE